MRTFILIAILLSLVTYNQKSFASEPVLGPASSPTLSTDGMNKNIQRMRNETMDYNSNLSNEMQKLQREPYNSYNRNQTDYRRDNNYQNQQYNTQNDQQQNQKEYDKSRHYNNYKETPKWWREENSYQGWGFN
ncbi:MAG: hypothetical protein MJ180_04980 [Candidatus Gastranaerophilales bacterium]|nr:hypothetical protein [Candidatus Gastranaerophilales bacterium]